MFSSSIHYPVSFQALQKICLVNHIKSMAELLHADAIQQLEVTLLGSPTAQILDLLSVGGEQLTPAPKGTVILLPKVYTSTLMAPPPTTVPIAGITGSLAIASVSAGETEVTALESQEAVPSIVVLKCHCIALIPVHTPKSSILPTSSSSQSASSKSPTYPTSVVPELTLPVEAQPKQLN